MTQSTTANVSTTPPTSGTEVVTGLNDLRESVISSHAGNTRPTYAVDGMIWYDNTNNIVYLVDGATDHEIGSIVGGKFVAKNADSATSATNAENILQATDPASGTYRLLLGNGTDVNSPAYNLTALYYDMSNSTIIGTSIDGNAGTATAPQTSDWTANGYLYEKRNGGTARRLINTYTSNGYEVHKFSDGTMIVHGEFSKSRTYTIDGGTGIAYGTIDLFNFPATVNTYNKPTVHVSLDTNLAWANGRQNTTTSYKIDIFSIGTPYSTATGTITIIGRWY